MSKPREPSDSELRLRARYRKGNTIAADNAIENQIAYESGMPYGCYRETQPKDDGWIALDNGKMRPRPCDTEDDL